MLKQKPAILFDFDGVLADTEPLHWECWNAVLSPFGVSISWQNYVDHCVGISDREFLETMGRHANPPRQIDELWPLYPQKKELLRDRAMSGNLILSETRRLLQDLAGHPMAVVTSSSRLEIEAILKNEKVFHLFQTAVYGDEVANLKPNPEPYLTAMQKLGVTQAIALEDSGPGKQSARAAGCELIEVNHAAEVPQLLRDRLQLA
ncbi:MAG: HAD family phosphatase [Acidobacteria bacterium]|nr:HAD family phosphatase [Acidobacteriota bacterium]